MPLLQGLFAFSRNSSRLYTRVPRAKESRSVGTPESADLGIRAKGATLACSGGQGYPHSSSCFLLIAGDMEVERISARLER
jgi:hypothetical protein